MEIEMKNHIKIITLLMLVFIILYILHITIGDRFDNQLQSSDNIENLTIYFSTDHKNKKLTVSDIYPPDVSYYWSEIEIVNGSATFDQYGIIEVGHSLSNCSGYLELKWKPSGIIIWQSDFRLIDHDI